VLSAECQLKFGKSWSPVDPDGTLKRTLIPVGTSAGRQDRRHHQREDQSSVQHIDRPKSSSSSPYPPRFSLQSYSRRWPTTPNLRLALLQSLRPKKKHGYAVNGELLKSKLAGRHDCRPSLLFKEALRIVMSKKTSQVGIFLRR
jgi:hypothetical protein